MSAINSKTSNAKGASVIDAKAQEIKDIGVAPIEREMKKPPMELEIEKNRLNPFHETDSSQAVQTDANILAMKSIGLNGFPE
ncbi:MAG: hypothetical protein LBB11_04295 [Puniceicoccales bacterium]|nr:hypothetical protein [Puniceicoccales bacterium]